MTSRLSSGMEKIRLMTRIVAPNEYRDCTGGGSYETSLPGLMQLRPTKISVMLKPGLARELT